MIGVRRTIGLAVLGAAALGLRLAVVLWAAGPVADDAAASLGWQLAQCLAGTALVLATAWLGWTLMPDRPAVGWLAGALAAIYPPHLFVLRLPDPFLPATLLAVLAMAAAHTRQWRAVRRWGAAAGLLAAAAMLLAPAAAACEPLSLAARMKAFWLFAGPGALAADRLCRFAAVAWLVMAGIGAAVSAIHWRALVPTYAAFALVAALVLSGHGPAELRMVVEPLTLLWAAWSLAPLLGRARQPERIRVYRPGEQARDPFDQPHVLRRPHYQSRPRRRAG
jgi:hypothetical protein